MRQQCSMLFHLLAVCLFTRVQFGWRFPKQMSCGLHALLFIKRPCRSHYRFVSTPLHDWESVCRFTCQGIIKGANTQSISKHTPSACSMFGLRNRHILCKQFCDGQHSKKLGVRETLESLNGSQWLCRIFATPMTRLCNEPL